MAVIEFYCDGKLHRMSAQPASKIAPKPAAGRKPGRPGAAGSMLALGIGAVVTEAIQTQASRLAALFHTVEQQSMLVAVPAGGDAAIVPTATLVVEGASKSELKKLMSDFGLSQVDEGQEGKVLLRAPDGGADGIRQAAAAAKAAVERGNVDAAHPNFVRFVGQIKPSAAGGTPLWNHDNSGNPGIIGADIGLPAAHTITRGSADVRVAVLDEGVDGNHPALKPALVADRDFVDGNTTSKPDGNDAHGTACAGIILSRNAKTPGIAPGCSLVGVRIAKGDGADGWVFDDFKTADAIDWAWKEGKADVLSNSWGGGPAVDAITRAFERARTKGRGGKGAVVVIATGNEDLPRVSYPAVLPNVLAVGASTPWDERKSRTSKDGENWWGSNYGPELSLVAPGVKIATTDIGGAKGYDAGGYVTTFNGTSSATPHVAAACALILSVAPKLTEARVREIVTASADRLTADGKWDKFVGWGRLNVYAALRLARRG